MKLRDPMTRSDVFRLLRWCGILAGLAIVCWLAWGVWELRQTYQTLLNSPAGQAAIAAEEIRRNHPKAAEAEEYCDQTQHFNWNESGTDVTPSFTHSLQVPGTDTIVPYTCEVAIYRCGPSRPPEISVDVWGSAPDGRPIVVGRAVLSSPCLH
jgi:hypothetical protein